MLLRKLRLDNVKCFAKGTTIDFMTGKEPTDIPHRWVVVYGTNGLGKTTLLRSIGVALTGQPALSYLLPSADGWVRGNQKSAKIDIEFSRNDAKGTGDVIQGQRKKPIEVSWTLVGPRATTIDGRKHGAGSVLLDAKLDHQLFESYVATEDEKHGWLLCGYGPHRRLTGASSGISDNIKPGSRASRLMTLFHEKAALTSAERWLIELDHEARKSKNSRELDHVKQMLNVGLLHDGVQLGEIAPDRVLFKTPFHGSVPMADLSDGYRTSLALALDLLRHVNYSFQIEKLLAVDPVTKRACVTAEGVVLIDEIDSHLHPEWQRTIGAWLHTTFPRMQFIVATHSPLIPERVSRDDGMVIRLRKRTQGQGEVVDAACERSTNRSLTADQNLTGENFGLRSTRDVMVDALLEKINTLSAKVRAKKASEADRKALKEAQLAFAFEAPPTLLEAQA